METSRCRVGVMEEEADDRDWDFWGEADDVGPTTVMDGFASLFPGNVATWSTQARIAFSLRWDKSSVFYADTGENIRARPRPCVGCGLPVVNPSDPDPCLGRLDGVRFACCGHRRTGWRINHGWRRISECTWRGCTAPYVAFDDQSVLRGDTALLWFADHGVGPDAASS